MVRGLRVGDGWEMGRFLGDALQRHLEIEDMSTFMNAEVLFLWFDGGMPLTPFPFPSLPILHPHAISCPSTPVSVLHNAPNQSSLDNLKITNEPPPPPLPRPLPPSTKPPSSPSTPHHPSSPHWPHYHHPSSPAPH